MKNSISTILSIALLAVSQAIAQESAIAAPLAAPVAAAAPAAPAAPAEPMATDMETHIMGGISDGTPSVPAPKPALPDFRVKGTVVRQFDVVEAPPMVGLPPVAGTITATVHLVEDPGLPDPPPPPPPLAVDDPTVQARLAKMTREYPDIQLLFLSATVYDHSRTLLRCYPSGNGKREVTAWSNLDFNHFSGFCTFQVKGGDGEVRSYGLIMGLGNEDTERSAKLRTEHGIEYDAPEIPALPDDKPAYVIEEDSPDPEAAGIIDDLHELYRVEGTRMAVAYQARIKAEEARRAYLLANPPKPKDVTIHFWERSHPVGMSADTIKKEGAK